MAVHIGAMYLSFKGLGEDVGCHIFGWTVDKLDLVCLDSIAYEVESNVDMFGASVELVVSSKSEGSLVVAV